MNDVEQLIRLSGRRPVASDEGRTRAHAAAHEAWNVTLTARRRQRRVVAGGLLLAAASVVLAVVLRRPPAAPVAVGAMAGVPVMAGATVSTEPGRFVVVQLEGGGDLLLHGDSRVRFAGVRRLTVERGHVYVDAGPADAASVHVDTPAGVVQDIGTRFTVAVSEAVVRVRVRDGQVRLSAQGQPVDAKAGEQIVVPAGAAPAVSATSTYGEDWEWVLQAVPFHADGATLERFLQWVEAFGGLHVEFVEPGLRERMKGTVLHGSIAHLRLADALDVILTASGLEHRIEGGRVTISRRAGGR